MQRLRLASMKLFKTINNTQTTLTLFTYIHSFSTTHKTALLCCMFANKMLGIGRNIVIVGCWSAYMFSVRTIIY